MRDCFCFSENWGWGRGTNDTASPKGWQSEGEGTRGVSRAQECSGFDHGNTLPREQAVGQRKDVTLVGVGFQQGALEILRLLVAVLQYASCRKLHCDERVHVIEGRIRLCYTPLRTGRGAARERTCMGCRGSVVQIHSPRPSNPNLFLRRRPSPFTPVPPAKPLDPIPFGLRLFTFLKGKNQPARADKSGSLLNQPVRCS